MIFNNEQRLETLLRILEVNDRLNQKDYNLDRKIKNILLNDINTAYPYDNVKNDSFDVDEKVITEETKDKKDPLLDLIKVRN